MGVKHFKFIIFYFTKMSLTFDQGWKRSFCIEQPNIMCPCPTNLVLASGPGGNDLTLTWETPSVAVGGCEYTATLFENGSPIASSEIVDVTSVIYANKSVTWTLVATPENIYYATIQTNHVICGHSNSLDLIPPPSP